MEEQNLNQNASYSDPVRQEPTIRPVDGQGSSSSKSSKGFPKWIIAIIGVVLILLVGGFFIVRSLGESEESEGPTPTPAGLSAFPTPNTTPTPEATPASGEVDKAEIKIEVLNGTGTAGEASFLQTKLKDLGYEEVQAANASSQDETETTATFSRDLPEEIVEEITEELEKIYTKVTANRGTVSGDFDIQILTGPRTGVATPTSSPRASASASPSPSSSPTASPSN